MMMPLVDRIDGDSNANSTPDPPSDPKPDEPSTSLKLMSMRSLGEPYSTSLNLRPRAYLKDAFLKPESPKAVDFRPKFGQLQTEPRSNAPGRPSHDESPSEAGPQTPNTLQLNRIGHPNVYRSDVVRQSPLPPPGPLPHLRPSTAINFSAKISDSYPSPSPSMPDTSRIPILTPRQRPQTPRQHPFQTPKAATGDGAASDARHSYQARYQARPKSPMDPNFRLLLPYMIGKNWSAKNATTFMVSKSVAKSSILKTCQQLQSIPMNIIFDNLRKIAKIGEGVFGEVYTGHFVDGNETAPPKVYKVVPIEGDKRVNQEQQKRYGEIEAEIIVSRRLNVLQDETKPNFTEGFAKLTGALVCRGGYPRVLRKAWKKYQKEMGTENDEPEFKDNQEYAVLESELCGSDVEAYTFTNAKQALALLIQVTHTLAVGEAGVKFEHRDLHWGNILVMATPKTQIKYKVNGVTLLVSSCGIKSTIIDFTIASTQNEDGSYTFTDMSQDEEQFNGDEDYQFEIYRMMRKELENDWSRFAPRNNIFWMHYLADKLIKRAHYADKTSPVHRKYMARLRYFKTVIKDFESCVQFALCYPEEPYLHVDENENENDDTQ